MDESSSFPKCIGARISKEEGKPLTCVEKVACSTTLVAIFFISYSIFSIWHSIVRRDLGRTCDSEGTWMMFPLVGQGEEE